MKIRSLTLKNIGVFEDETISFPEKQEKEKAVSTGAEIHILTGQNGTGKTTILQALASGVINSYFFLGGYSRFYNRKNFIKRIRNNSDVGHIVFDNNQEISLDAQKEPSFYRDETYDYAKIILPEEDEKKWFLHRTLRNTFKFIGFAYSGYRSIEDQENINIKEKENYNPLENALEFNKKNDTNDYTLNEWLANKMAQRNSAFFDGNTAEVEKYSRGIETLKQIIEQIIEIPIDFKFKNEKLKVVAVKQGQELDFDLLPDGLRSIISWLGDLIMRMDALKWKDDLPIFEREFILFLDEIEVHLHPSWQRKILPVVQKLFKNAQIFITTHSPFIVNSIDGAWIYELDLDENGHSKVTKVTTSDSSKSYQNIIREVFEVSRFSESLEKELKEFTDTRNDILLNKNIDENEFLNKAHQLASLNDEVKNTILFELRQLSKKTGKEYAL